MQEGDFAKQDRVLTSWKEIAAYLGKGVRTVQRWEKDFALPIRRPNRSDKSSILARTRDLDAWVAMRCSVRTDTTSDEHQRMLSVRSALMDGLNTAQILRETNFALISEMRSVLSSLQSEILRMHAVACRPTSPTPISVRAAATLPRPDEFPSSGAA